MQDGVIRGNGRKKRGNRSGSPGASVQRTFTHVLSLLLSHIMQFMIHLMVMLEISIRPLPHDTQRQLQIRHQL